MINKVGQIMLYVNNQDQSRDFFTEKLGFQVIDEVVIEEIGMRSIEVAPANGAGSSIVLHNKEFVAKFSPGLNLGTPSLLFFSDDLDRLYADLKNKNVKVGDLVEMPTGGRVFNFADDEENYFAVMEKK
ncbi:VOC family protein [Paenibacillus sp.]|uniref:VOC family protein n=1 Tax=Paenibacillus sp. TaxID=58172 RepID=UPI002812210D|nr:VOC family protein [Paenibacillus sp.]